MNDLLTSSGALFDNDRSRRVRLWRIWDKRLPVLIVIGMNPSKADETDNDPTVERVQRRATNLGYGGFFMLNMLDVIETDSRKLDAMSASERCSPINSEQLLWALDKAKDGKADVLCAWGKPGQKYGAVAWFATQAARRKVTLFCLGCNKDGSPVHPLYQPYSKEFEWYAGADAAYAAKPLYVLMREDAEAVMQEAEHQEEMRQLEEREMEAHFMKHPHG